MTTTTRFIDSCKNPKDANFEQHLRPQSLDEFLGQDKIRDRLNIFTGAAMKRGEPLSHCLFCGPPGLGKTTLSNIIAKTMGTNIVSTSGPVIEKAGDLAGLLTNLQEGDVLFIDEIHRLNRTIEEYLYPAMEDFHLDLVIDSGPNARSVQINLNRFTLVGATTRLGLLTSPLRSRFAVTMRLDYYEESVLENIIMRSAGILNFEIDKPSAASIASRSRGTPRIANHLLKWVRDYSQMRANNRVNTKIVCDALDMLAVDHRGLDEMDKRMLEVIINNYDGGPVGLNTIAVAIGEETSTLEEVYEPYLIMQGFLKRTPRGREATSMAYKHLEGQL